MSQKPNLIIGTAGFSLPLDAVTQTFAILARKRSGKSFTARRFAEELLSAGQQVVIVDPKGDWWGIRSSADGKGPGYPVIVLGGEHGDLPLETGTGEVVAKLIVHEKVSVLLDLSDFRKGEVARFMGGQDSRGQGFLEAIYRLKNREAFRSPFMLIVDEADAIAPQKPFKGEERMLGAMEDIVRRGGQRGIGCTTVTQRSAVLNKNVLTQSQVLVAMCTIAPQDLAAMKAWIDVHGTLEQQAILMSSLPSLPVGDAWVWSPGWPTLAGIFERMHIAPIRTFDSGATPKPGQKRVAPKTIADIDLDALQRQMAATIEKAKADDPAELRKQIAELKKQLAKPAPTTPPVIDESVIAARVKKAVEKALAEQRKFYTEPLKSLGRVLSEATNAHMKGIGEFQFTMDPLALAMPSPPRPIAAAAPQPAMTAHVRPVTTRLVTADQQADQQSDIKLSSGQRKVLMALAQYPDGRTDSQVAILTIYASGTGGFNNIIGSLRTAGFIEGGKGNLRITQAGLDALGHFDPLPTGHDLLNHWLPKLGKAEKLILTTLAKVYPESMTDEDVASKTSYAAGTGGFNNALGRLRTLELITGNRKELKASEVLF
jgi:hypothetical protein